MSEKADDPARTADDPGRKPIHVQPGRGGKWLYRKRVPKDLLEVIGRGEVKLTLGTESYDIATLAASMVDREVERRFAEIRLGLAAETEDTLSGDEKTAKEVAEAALGRLKLGK